MRGADVIVEHLIREGVTDTFGVCGHGNIGLLDALYERQDRIRTISTHHEQTAGHMADAYFRVARRPAATFTSTGPGSSNLPVALASAMMDSAAFLAITGNVPTSQFGRGAFQESYRHYQADFPSVVRPYVKRSFQPTRPEQLPLMLRQAFQVMLGGRPGPVHLDVPLDLFVEEAPVAPGGLTSGAASVTARPGGEPERVRRAVALLLSAERPVILAGNGAVLSDAGAALAAVAERLGIPVVTTPLAAGLLPAGHPLEFGRPGRNGAWPANQATRKADVILAVGARFDDRVSSSWVPGYTFSIPPTQLIQVDIDPQELGRNYPVTVGIIGDARAVLEQVLAELERLQAGVSPQQQGWLAQVQEWRRAWNEYIAAVPDGPTIAPQRVLAALERTLPEDAILLTDVGVHHNWLVQLWRPRRERSFLQSWGFGSMGFGVSGVLGAKVAAPDRPCVAVCGDGGFLMTPHVMATAVEYDLPVVWLVWNNCGYVAIRDLQLAAFGPRELATSFVREKTGEPFSADFAALARSMGGEGLTVTRAADLEGALAHALVCGRPCVLDVRVDREIRPAATGGWQLPPLPAWPPTFQGSTPGT